MANGDCLCSIFGLLPQFTHSVELVFFSSFRPASTGGLSDINKDAERDRKLLSMAEVLKCQRVVAVYMPPTSIVCSLGEL